MARTTVTAVKKALGQNYDTVNCPSIDWAIAWAYGMVTRVAAECVNQNETLGSADAANMEGLLAAYAYTQQDPMYTNRSTLSASGAFKLNDDIGNYLSLAQALDPTGTLLALVKGNRAGGSWAGKTETEQLAYDERN